MTGIFFRGVSEVADGTPGSNLNWKASKGLTGSEDIFLKYPSLAIMEAVDNFV